MEDAVTTLTGMDRIVPYVLSMMVDDVALRYVALESFSPPVKERWDVCRNERQWDVADPVRQLHMMHEFVRREEVKIGTRPTRSSGKVLREPWEDLAVPAAFADAVRPVIPSSDGFTRATDVSRVFADFVALDDFSPTGHRDHAWNRSVMTDSEKGQHLAFLAQGQQLGMTVLGDGRWLGRGTKARDFRGRIAPTLRFYIPIEPHHADSVMQIMNGQYDQWIEQRERPDIQFTIATMPGRLSRVNALVVSTNAENQEIWRDLADIREAIPEYFRWEQRRPSTSAELVDDNGIRTGIFVSESRRRVQDGDMVARLAGRALGAFRNRVLRGHALTTGDLIRVVAHEADRAGIDLERPAFFGADGRHSAGWQLFKEVFRHTDQYNADVSDSDAAFP